MVSCCAEIIKKEIQVGTNRCSKDRKSAAQTGAAGTGQRRWGWADRLRLAGAAAAGSVELEVTLLKRLIYLNLTGHQITGPKVAQT